MNRILLLIMLAGVMAGSFFGYRVLAPQAPSRGSNDQARLSASQTRQVLGANEVVTASPSDPLLSMVSASKSTVSAIPASLAADGTGSTTVVVTVRTADGSVVEGAQVTLQSTRGQQDVIEVVRGITAADGQAIFTVKSLEPGTVILTATAGTKLLDTRATAKFVDAPVATAGWSRQVVAIGIAVLVLVVFFQYLFVRTVLSAKTRAESELFFHHPQAVRGK